jgi:hypothetical protein
MDKKPSRDERIEDAYQESARYLAEALVDQEDLVAWLIEEKIMPSYLRNLSDMVRLEICSLQEAKAMAIEYRLNLYKGK